MAAHPSLCNGTEPLRKSCLAALGLLGSLVLAFELLVYSVPRHDLERVSPGVHLRRSVFSSSIPIDLAVTVFEIGCYVSHIAMIINELVIGF